MRRVCSSVDVDTRLVLFLRSAFPQVLVSRNLAERGVKGGCVSRNGEPALTTSLILREGDIIELNADKFLEIEQARMRAAAFAGVEEILHDDTRHCVLRVARGCGTELLKRQLSAVFPSGAVVVSRHYSAWRGLIVVTKDAASATSITNMTITVACVVHGRLEVGREVCVRTPLSAEGTPCCSVLKGVRVVPSNAAGHLSLAMLSNVGEMAKHQFRYHCLEAGFPVCGNSTILTYRIKEALCMATVGVSPRP
jgi:ribosomal 50S subunit-recycling heat shock protein